MLEWVLLQKQEDPPGTLTNVPGATLLAVSPSGQAWLRYDDPSTKVRYSWRGRTADPLALDYVASFETLEDGLPDGPPASTGHLSIVRSGQTLVIGRDVRGPKTPGRGSIHPLIPVLSGGMLLPDVATSLARHVECDAEEAIAPPDFDKESLAPFDMLELTHELTPHERVTLRITGEGVFVVFVDEFPGFGSRERLEAIAGPEMKTVLDNLLFATAAPLFVPPAQKIMPADASPMSLAIFRGHRRIDLIIDKFRARDMPRWTHLVRALEGLTETPSQRVYVGLAGALLHLPTRVLTAVGVGSSSPEKQAKRRGGTKRSRGYPSSCLCASLSVFRSELESHAAHFPKTALSPSALSTSWQKVRKAG